MDSVALFKMDIFFVVTTVVVVFLGLLGAIILFYIFKIVKGVHAVIQTVQKEAEDISRDFKEIRKEIKEGVHEVHMGVSSATHFTKTVAGAGIVRALSGLFDAFVQEKEQSKTRKRAPKETK